MHPQVNEEYVASSFLSINGDVIRYRSRQMTFKLKDIPSLDKEKDIWYPKDYRAQISFQLMGIKLPNSSYQSYTTTWKDLYEILKNNEFGHSLEIKNPFKEEMKSLDLSILSIEDQVRTLFKLLKTKITWNNKYRFTP